MNSADENNTVTPVKASDDVINVVKKEPEAASIEATAPAPVVDGTAENTVGGEEAGNNPASPTEEAEPVGIPPGFFQTAKYSVSAAAVSQDELNEFIKRLVDLVATFRTEFQLEHVPTVKVEVQNASGNAVRYEVLLIPKKMGGGYRVSQI